MHHAAAARFSLLLAPVALLALTGCATHLKPMDAMDWDTQPRMVYGDVRVAPVVVVAEVPQVDLTGAVGEELDSWRAEGRLTRTAELAELPYVIRSEVPGALNKTLGHGWTGHFRDARLTWAQELAIINALQRDRGTISQVTGDIAGQVGGDATLFTWVIENEGAPLTDEYMVGELVFADGLPVMVEHGSEPYRVQVEVGVALVAADGTLLFRYQDEYRGLLADGSPLDSLARDMARELVDDIAPLWLDDVLGGQQALAQAE